MWKKYYKKYVTEVLTYTEADVNERQRNHLKLAYTYVKKLHYISNIYSLWYILKNN